MKKLSHRILILFCLIAFMVTACARKKVAGEPQNLDDLNGKVAGFLVSPALVTPQHIEEEEGFRPREVRSFPTANDLFTALKSKRVDFINILDETSRFLMTADVELRIITPRNLNDGLRMIMRESDAGLCEEINAAIASLKADGTLSALYEEYVKNVSARNLSGMAVEIPEIPGAEKILIGINGDLPPFDYLTADGKPAGYNVALSTEISRFLGKNIQFVQIPSDARFSALLSKNVRRMDVFFWYYGNIAVDGIIATDVYADVKASYLVRK